MVLGNEVHANTAEAALISVVTNGGTTALSSGKWGAVAALAPTDASTGTFTRTGVIRSTATAKGSYFSIRNVGTLSLLSMSLTLTTTGGGSYTTNIHRCTTTWTESNGSCPGGTITLVRANTNAQNATITWTMAIAPSTNVRLRLQYVAGGTRTVNATVSLAVARVNVQAATNTNI